MLASLMHFAIIPNIHPILVHFTIALFSVSFILHAIYYFGMQKYAKTKLISEIEIVARWCLWLTIFFSTLTVLAGLYAYYTVPHNEAGHIAMGIHRNSAFISFSLILITGIYSILQFITHRKISLITLILLGITQISILITGYLGSEVVYRYGIGVIPAQTSEMMIGHSHHHEEEDTTAHTDENMSDMKMDSMDAPHEHKANNDPEDNAKKVPLYWIDTMEPTVHYNKPGKSAMGMELIPVYSKPTTSTDLKNTITLPRAYIDNLGVVSVPVMSGNLDNSINTYAYVEPAETNIAYVTVYANGWVRKLLVRSVGSPIKKGQLLAQIYSPIIINAEEEYLMANQSGNKVLAAAAIKKLTAFHVSTMQIQQLQQTHTASQLINIYAPQNGIVSELNVRDGDYVTPETKIFNVVDLSSVWLIAAVFEKQAKWLKVGNTAIAKFAAYPDKVWTGRVEYIYPQLDAQTRSLKARLRFDNPELLLKPNMYGNIIIATKPTLGSLSVPSQAIIHDAGGNRVIVALGKGVFQVRKVTLGEETNGIVEVLSGLNLGENVVKSGEFMLDSDASLNAASDRIDSSSPALKGN